MLPKKRGLLVLSSFSLHRLYEHHAGTGGINLHVHAVDPLDVADQYSALVLKFFGSPLFCMGIIISIHQLK